MHPTRREVHGRACVPTLDDLPEPVDAVVVAIPAAGVPAVARAAGRRGCGGLVVFAAGFGEAGGAGLQAELREAALAARLPVIGPNCDGMVAFHGGAALWGDALVARPPGRVALVSQSGNVAVNALAVGRGIAFHTVASVGNQAVVGAADLLAALVEDDDVGSVALFLEADGDGERLAAALARAAEREVGVAVLKVGATRGGRRGRGGAHRRARRRPARVPRPRGGGGRGVGRRRPRPARAGQGDGGARRPAAGRSRRRRRARARRRARDPHVLGRRLGPGGG